MAGALTTLSEAESKALVARFGVPVPDERVVATVRRCGECSRRDRLSRRGEALRRGDRPQDRAGTRTPAVCGATATSRPRRGELLGAPTAEDGEVGVLVAPMVVGNRELIAGLNRDPQFGMTVMLGIGGVLAEAVGDVTFRARADRQGRRTRDDRRSRTVRRCSARSAANRRSTASVSPTCCSGCLKQRPRTRRSQSVDLNPLIVANGVPVAVDALVEVER